jgi:hypothetical protein
LFSDQGDVWVIYRNSSDSDLYAARSTTDGSTWLTPVNIFTATIASAAVNLSVDATIYQRGNNVVIPYIVNDAGTLKYNEYTVRTTTPPAAVLTALPGAVTLAGPSVKLARAHDFNVTAGAVALAGQNVTLRYGHKFQAGVKAFAVAGKPASLVPYGYLLDYPAGVAILQVGGTGGHQKVAQEITVPAGKRWTITDYTGKYETFGATDQIMMEIRQGAPDGALIATATNTGSTSTIQSSIWGGTWFSFRFNNPELDPGTYFFVISRTGALNDLAYWHVWFNYNNYSGGTAYSCVGGVWSLDYVAGIDLTTQVVGKESVFTSNKVLIAETGAVALAGQNVTLTKAGAIAYLRPDGDVATDGWTDQAGGTSNIYQSIDEATADDLDYVQSPDLVSTSLAVRLFEGSTQIATWSHPSPGTTFATAEQTLTGPEFAAIGNFSNLFVEFDDGSSNVYRAPLSNPPAGAAAPAILRYRYKKLVTGSATTTWNPSDKAPGITVDGTNLIVGSLGAGGYPGIRAIASHTGSGLYFCSIKMDAYTWPNAVVFGIANGTGSLLGSGSPFYSNNMMGMNVDGAVWLNGAQIGTSTGHYYANAVADMCVDIGLKLVWWRLDGGPWNANASNNPVTGVGGISYAGMAGDTGAIYPYIAVEATSSTVRTNFGATTYTYAKPAGASDW